MSDIVMIMFAILDLIIMYICAEQKYQPNAAMFMFFWVLSQPIYWVILLLIFDRRGV